MLFRKTLLTLCLTSLLFGAGGSFMSKNSPLFSDASAKEALGELIVSAEVKELSKNGEYTEVEFTGYQPKDSRVVYEKTGVLIVGFETAIPSAVKIIGEKTDEYGTVWSHVTVKGFVVTSALGKDKGSILQAGKDLFSAKCGTCHALHAENEFDANVWPSILEAMGEQAALSKDEKYSIMKYLQNYK